MGIPSPAKHGEATRPSLREVAARKGVMSVLNEDGPWRTFEYTFGYSYIPANESLGAQKEWKAGRDADALRRYRCFTDADNQLVAKGYYDGVGELVAGLDYVAAAENTYRNRGA